MEKKTIGLLVLVVIVVIAAIVFFIYGSRSGKHSPDQKPPKYSFTNAVATNVSITGNTTSKIFTADFDFTVTAYNPNKNHTLYYGGGEATASFHRKHHIIMDVLASAVTMPPALPLLPRASALFTYNLRAQGVALGEDSSYLFAKIEDAYAGYVRTMLTVNVTAWFDNENSTSPSPRRLIVLCYGVGFDSTYSASGLIMYDPYCESSF